MERRRIRESAPRREGGEPAGKAGSPGYLPSLAAGIQNIQDAGDIQRTGERLDVVLRNIEQPR